MEFSLMASTVYYAQNTISQSTKPKTFGSSCTESACNKRESLYADETDLIKYEAVFTDEIYPLKE